MSAFGYLFHVKIYFSKVFEILAWNKLIGPKTQTFNNPRKTEDNV